MNPPKFHKDYKTWKQEIDLWTNVTGLAKAKRGIAVCLTLKGKAKEVGLELGEDLGGEDGLGHLLRKLDTLFLKTKNESNYEAYKNFDTIKRKANENIADNIVDFDSLYTKIRKREMVLPEAALAFKLLDGAGLTENQRQLALTACSDLKYENMKAALKRVFGGALSDHGATEDKAIFMKQEVVYSASNGGFGNRPRTSQTRNQPSRNTHPLNRFGQPSRCRICQSIFHYAKDCPDKSEKVK